eukprot:Em0017g743a
MLSAGAEDADILFEDELRLAIKSMLGIPWILNRWLKQAGVGQHILGRGNTFKNKAKARARYKADPEKKKALVRDSYKADPEKKKASRYQEGVEENRAAKWQRYQEDVEENRAAKRQKYEDNSAAMKGIGIGITPLSDWLNVLARGSGSPNYHYHPKSYSLYEPKSHALMEYNGGLEKAILRDSELLSEVNDAFSTATAARSSAAPLPSAASSSSRAAPTASSRSRSTTATSTSPTTGTDTSAPTTTSPAAPLAAATTTHMAPMARMKLPRP